MQEDAAPFFSTWLKWAWASAHAETLETEIREYAIKVQREGGVTATSRYDPKCHCVIAIARTIPDYPVHLGLILGDVIQAYRSSLDQLAWALVQRGRTHDLSERAARRVYFPFAEEPSDFNDCLGVRLPGVTRTDIAKIRRYQPYHAGKRKLARHPLGTLAKLSNHDKHRTVQPLWGVPVESQFQITQLHDCVVTRIPVRGRPKRLEVGTEIMRIYVRRTGTDPGIDMEGTISVEPFVDDFMLLSDWLTKTTELTGLLLREFAEPPKGLLDTIAPVA